MNGLIATPRLSLVPVWPAAIEAFFKSRAELSALLKAEVPEDWPVFPEGMAYWQRQTDSLINNAGWYGYFFIHRQDNRVIGDGGFKGPPDASGEVEIGYALIQGYRHRGLAGEAARALAAWAFAHPEVTAIKAETLAEGRESIRLLQTLGMEFGSERRDAEEGRIFLWRLSRNRYQSPNAPQ